MTLIISAAGDLFCFIWFEYECQGSVTPREISAGRGDS